MPKRVRFNNSPLYISENPTISEDLHQSRIPISNTLSRIDRILTKMYNEILLGYIFDREHREKMYNYIEQHKTNCHPRLPFISSDEVK